MWAGDIGQALPASSCRTLLQSGIYGISAPTLGTPRPDPFSNAAARF